MDPQIILDALPLPVVVCDPQGKVLAANAAAERWRQDWPEIGGQREWVSSLQQHGLFEHAVSDCRLRVPLRDPDGERVLVSAAAASFGSPGNRVAVVLMLDAPSDNSSDRVLSSEVEASVGEGPPPESRRRLLVVDDEDMVRTVISTVLTKSGFEVVEAEDGEDALRKCETGVFDLALVDLFMPRLNGLETLRKLRSMQPQLRGVVLTGVADLTEYAQEESGVTFLQKPFDNLALVQLVTELLSSSGEGSRAEAEDWYGESGLIR